MALVPVTVENTIKSALDAEFGTPADEAAQIERDRYASAFATAIIDILTTQMTIIVTTPDTINGTGVVS